MTQPIQGYAQALAAYGRAAASAEGAPAADAAGEAANGGSFAGILRQTLDTVAETGRATEALAVGAVQDGANLSQVVAAVAEAEVTLQSVVAVRDKVIGAYQQIMRMQI
jgi:flagellar hook-basal body complex protein FliE